MVLTKDELIGSLQHEVRILRHLASKIDPSMVDYRPTSKQRSTLDLLRYLSMMGPTLVEVAQSGTFDAAAWTRGEKAAEPLTFAEAVTAIADHANVYESQLGGMTEADFRAEIAPFGHKTTRGSFIVNNVLSGCAAYRMQLFLYLKACGRDELGTMNLWAGADA
jgi:hypothetical protein